MEKKRMIGPSLAGASAFMQEGAVERLIEGTVKEADRLAKQMQKDMEEMNNVGLTKKERNAIIVPVRTEPKIGRNDLCPCESGKKYKKCCG